MINLLLAVQETSPWQTHPKTNEAILSKVCAYLEMC